MKTYKLLLADGTSIQLDAAKVDRDGMGVHLYDADGNLVAGFTLSEVRAIFPVSAEQTA